MSLFCSATAQLIIAFILKTFGFMRITLHFVAKHKTQKATLSVSFVYIFNLISLQSCKNIISNCTFFFQASQDRSSPHLQQFPLQ